MTLIKNKYDYKEIKKASVEGRRLYACPDGNKVASVTTILDATKDKTHLIAWRKRVGETKAKEITTEAAGVGTRMHKYLEDYVNGEVLKESVSNPYAQQSLDMAKIVVKEGLKNVDEYWGTEVALYFPQIYAGTTDCVGVHKGEDCIMDFKQTNKPKKREWIDDYFLQLGAYAMAHNILFKTQISKGVIMMCSADNFYQEFVVEGEEFQKYKHNFLRRVDEYYRHRNEKTG